MRIASATKLLNEMTSMTRGSFYLYCVISDIGIYGEWYF